MAKINLKKDLKHLYHPSAQAVSVVDVPPLDFLTIDGKGNPNTSQEYAEAVQALYALAYALKFKVKKSKAKVDYAVMPLEGLWWVDDMRQFSLSTSSLRQNQRFEQSCGREPPANFLAELLQKRKPKRRVGLKFTEIRRTIELICLSRQPHQR